MITVKNVVNQFKKMIENNNGFIDEKSNEDGYYETGEIIADLFKKVMNKPSNKALQFIGSGTYASVFYHKSLKNYVFKICHTAESKNYLNFAKYCIANKENKNLPKIIGIINTSNEYCIVVIERLYTRTNRAIALSDTYERCPASHTPLFDTIDNISGNLNCGSLDIHGGNIMFRKNNNRMIPVIIDPVMG